jgi:hypothetical protein
LLWREAHVPAAAISDQRSRHGIEIELPEIVMYVEETRSFGIQRSPI